MYARTMQTLRRLKCCNGVVVGILAVVHIAGATLCKGEDPSQGSKLEMVQPPMGQPVLLDDGSLVRNFSGLTDLVVTFAARVHLELTSDPSGDATSSSRNMISLKPIVPDESEWLIQFGRVVSPDEWIGLAIDQDQLLVFTVSAQAVQQEGVLWLSRTAELVNVAPALVDAQGFVHTMVVVQPVPDSNQANTGRPDGSRDEAIEGHNGRGTKAGEPMRTVQTRTQTDSNATFHPLTADVEAACCTYGGACAFYPDGCPQGMTQVSCPCAPSG